jgi:hypothetical protein
MSAPRTEEEWARHNSTQDQAGPAENVVSTACENCELRFTQLAEFKCWDAGDTNPYWKLRCVNCGNSSKGVLKPLVHDKS